ncbi:MAG: hypothetical protein ACOY4T_08260 [Pseudomonadota bacterium]
MGISEELIERLSSETGRLLTDRARAGRRRALASIARVVVTLTRDGTTTWEEHFDRPPTLGRIVERPGRTFSWLRSPCAAGACASGFSCASRRSRSSRGGGFRSALLVRQSW